VRRKCAHSIRKNLPAYRPGGNAPQEGINLSVNALPVPKNFLSWTAVPGAAGYQLYRNTDPASGYNQIGGNLNTLLYVDANVYGGITYYYRVSAYNALGEGEKSPAVSATPLPAVSLTEKVWAEESLNAGEVQWYMFTAAAGTTYRIQWNGAAPQGDGAKTLPVVVSAYTDDGALIFEDKTEGWTTPETLSGLTGTVYLKVEGADGAGGTFALWYYDPVTTPPAVLYVGSAANPEPSVTSLEGAFTWLNANVASNTAYTIIVYQNTTMPARPLTYSGKTNVGLTIKGNGNGRSVQLSGTGNLFMINSGVTLTVENITLRGRRNTSTTSNTASLVSVNGGSLEMRQDSLITGNYKNSNGGGGVYFLGGSFTKKGGTIYGDTDTAHTAGSTENTASSGNGHAVYLYNSSKKRNSTAGPTVNLYANYTSNAWTFNDTSVDGAGDTTANWE
jgi:hypothetical protein